MLTILSVEQRIRDALEKLLGPEVRSISNAQSFRDFLGERFDSLMAVEVILTIEGCFGIEVDFMSDDVRYWFETLGKLQTFVVNKLSDQATLGAI